MKSWASFALATAVAVVLSTQVRSHAAAEKTSNESAVQSSTWGSWLREKHKLRCQACSRTLTGQPAPALRSRPQRPPPRPTDSPLPVPPETPPTRLPSLWIP